jgi:predicted PurR-regulated permease PerM
VGGYLGGLLGICAVNAILTTVVFVILGTPFFLPLGILAGSSSLVPYAGPLVAGATVTVFVLVTGGAWKALAAAIYFVLYGQLEGNVLAPLVYRRTVDVNPLVTLLAILFLAEFMGIAGAIMAVPLAAAGQIVVREVLAHRRIGGGPKRVGRSATATASTFTQTRCAPKPPQSWFLSRSTSSSSVATRRMPVQGARLIQQI